MKNLSVAVALALLSTAAVSYSQSKVGVLPQQPMLNNSTPATSGPPATKIGTLDFNLSHRLQKLGEVPTANTAPDTSGPPANVLTPISLDDANATEVVATLDTQIPKGKNAIWCASFLAAWKTLAEQVAQEPVSLRGAAELVTSLNGAPDPRPMIPPEGLYVAAGWAEQGIIQQIQREVVQKFPSKKAPEFPSPLPISFVAYSYLEANVKFSLPYLQNRNALEFKDSAGQKTPVVSFGIRPGDHTAYFDLRKQARILFQKGTSGSWEVLSFDEVNNAESTVSGDDLEFAIDLCPESKPSQIVVARINREPTLAAAVARVERESKEMESRGRHDDEFPGIGSSDVLLVPNLFWKLSHHFAELEGKALANPKLKGQWLAVAQQDILFRLDRSGAELKSESKIVGGFGVPTQFVLDRPFLIYMSQRGSKTPYFAMWVDNAEFLAKWPN